MDVSAQIVGYSAAVTAAVHGLVWVAKKLTTKAVDEAENEAKADEWFRVQLEKAGVKNDDCTARVNTLTQKISEQDVKINSMDSRLRECHDGRARDIAERHAIGRQLRELSKKYDDIRQICDSITELPPASQQPPTLAILQPGDDP